jgi:ketosteroid isomerase-like protein
MRTLVAVVGLALVWSGATFAETQQDSAAVCAASERHYAAIRAGDMNAILEHHAPEFTFFTSDGGLLWSFRSIDQQRTEFQIDPSFASTTYVRHCSAQVYGNVGIATYYLVGSVVTGGRSTSGTWRVTEVWVKQGDDWKEVHHHESPLLGSARPSPMAAAQE